MSDTDTAVTVIGGYLGAGKTTLVNHILRTAGERIAVLVNDFGDINIDAELIERQDGETISLANGCICCSLVDGFSAALATVQATEPPPTRLVIESSGVADPATVAAYGHGPGLSLDATIVVADAETIRAKASDEYVGDTVLRQLGSGDIVVLNKIDLVSDENAELTKEWIRERSPDASIITAVDGVVDPTALFGVVEPQAGIDDQRHKKSGRSTHAEAMFESWSWSTSAPVPRHVIERLMELMPDEVVRAKGIVVLGEDPDHLTALQRVGRRWSLRATRRRVDDNVTRLVVIGFRGAISDQWLAEQLG